jgi:hypothetical protein
MKQIVRTGFAVVLLSLGSYSHSFAQSGCTTGGTGCGPADTGSAPEIDPSMTGSGAVLLGGVVLLIRSRRR